MSSADYLSGALGFAVILGCATVAASVLVARRRPADLTGAPRAVAWGVVFAAFVFTAHMIPGVLGGLAEGTVIVTSVMLLAIALSIPERLRRTAPPSPPEAPEEPRWALWVGGGAAVAVAAYLIGWALDNGGQYLGQQDVVSFHLPNVAAWIQDGSLWGIHDWIPNRAPGNYPQTGDVFMLAAILPWDSDFIVRFVGYPFVGLCGLAVYAGARELAVPKGISMLAAAALTAMPAVSYVAVEGLADPEMYGLFAAGGFFALRHWRTGDRFDLVLAGVGLGLAFGSRWYGVAAVGAVFVVWAVAALSSKGRGGRLRDGATLLGLIALFGGFWLLRNWIESGNPVFPVDVSLFGWTIFEAPGDAYRELYGFTLANYFTDFDVLGDYIWSSFLDFLSFTALALWIGCVAALVVVRRRGPQAGRVVALVATAALIAIAYIATPYTGAGEEGVPFEAWVNSRYVVPALVCAAPVLAWLVGNAGALRPFLIGVLALAVADALRRAMDFPGGDVSLGALLAGLAIAALAVAITVRILRAELPPPKRRLRVLVAAGAVFVAACIVGAWQENRFAEDRYVGLGPEVDYVNDTAAPGSRIGIVGDGFVNYPLFGDRLDNHVAYVGERRQEMLRPIGDYDRFAAALDRGRYDLIAWRSLDTLDPDLPLKQAKWLERAGWERPVGGTNPLLNSEVAVYLPPEKQADAEGSAGGLDENQ